MTPFCHSTVSIPNPNSLMSLSSTLRLSSSLLRRSLSRPRHFSFPLADPLCRLRRTQPSGLRFLSSLPPQSSNNNGGLVVSGDNNNNNKDGGGEEEPRIVPFELHKEATESYMSYALSVLLGRALPDVRDGLKPVHRRILLSVEILSLFSSKKKLKIRFFFKV